MGMSGGAFTCIARSGSELAPGADDRSFLDSACRAGERSACARLAELLARGDQLEVARARQLYRRACDAGYAKACVAASEMMYDGLGGPVDQLGAEDLVHNGCAVGYAPACTRAGEYFGQARPERDARAGRARHYFLQGCEGGDLMACGALGRILATYSSSSYRSRARELLEQACEGPDARACFELASLELENAGVQSMDASMATENTADPRIAEWFGRACDADVAPACHALGRWREHAGQNTDWYAAQRHYLRGCELGSDPACTRLADFRVRGVGDYASLDAEDNELEAMGLLTAACERDYLPACVEQGKLLLTRRSSPEMARIRAGQLFATACDAGDEEGCFQWAESLSEGSESEAEQARDLYAKLCGQGRADACYRDASMLRQGRGGVRNPTRAASVLAKACKLGSQPACSEIEEQRMRRAQAAQARATERARERQIRSFRSRIGRGDQSHCGLVIEVRRPVASVQTRAGVFWFAIDQLLPQDAAPCRVEQGAAGPETDMEQAPGPRAP